MTSRLEPGCKKALDTMLKTVDFPLEHEEAIGSSF